MNFDNGIPGMVRCLKCKKRKPSKDFGMGKFGIDAGICFECKKKEKK